jgi:glycosyltransferase involved in cell wall biosynthesis
LYGNSDPGYRELIIEESKRLNLNDDVKIFNSVYGSHKWDVYQSANIFVLPSYSENFGIVIAEAMLAGLPVITTSSTPWRILADRGMGWIVDNDVNQLSKALREAIEMPDEQRKKMGLRAQDYAREHFLWAKVLPKYAETYAWVAGAKNDKPGWVFID